MKSLRILSVLFVFTAAIGLVSCDDNFEPIGDGVGIGGPDTPPTGPEVEPGTFKVNFDGGTYSTTATTAYISGTTIKINALRPQGDSFEIILQGTTPGNYEANDNFIIYRPANAAFGYSGNHPTNANAQTGIITITQIDPTNHTFSGTFNYTGYWTDGTVTLPTKQFVNGVFNALPYVSDAPFEDNFFANLDGEEFEESTILKADSIENNLQYYSVSGVGADNASITVTMVSTLTVGEYQITGDTATDVVQLLYARPGDTIPTAASSGYVTIVEKTATHLKCTFTGSVTIDGTTYQITQGNFHVAY